MPLPSGAHVQIGSDTFFLAEDMEDHYVHNVEGLFAPKQAVSGSPGKEQLKSDILLWSMTDWSGGEGNRVYYPDDPFVYHYAEGLNGRIRGQLTGRPARTKTDVTYADRRHRPTLVVADSALWLAGSTTLAYTTDGTSWTAKTSGVSNLITAAAGDHEYLYYTDWVSTASGTRILRRVNVGGAAADVVASATGKAPYAGMAVMNGRLYAWTGRKVFEHDIFESVPLASDKVRKVYDTGVDPASSNVFGTAWWGDIVATENSVVFWYSTVGQSNVYEYKNGVGRPIWQPPYGFTVKSAVYQNGIVFFTGHWGGSGIIGPGVAYALPLDSRRPIFLGYMRKDLANLQMQETAQSYGAQALFCAAWTGRIFVYDAEMDAFSLLDDLVTDSQITFTDNEYRIGDVATYGKYRIAAVYHPDAGSAGTTIQLLAYEDDEPANREDNVNATLYMGRWDYDFPFDRKTLIGVHVAFDPLVTNQSITVSYSLDGNSYVDLTAITSAHADNSKGRVFIPVSTTSATKKFWEMKWKVNLSGGASSVLTPILKAVTWEAKLSSREELWSLLVRVKDEQSNTRVAGRRAKGQTIRDWLITSARNNDVVTFKDAYTESGRQSGDSYSVTIDRAEDVITEAGEGVMRVLLRKVTE